MTFSLEGSVPAGATINASTGAFSWTPTEAQGPGTYTFKVRVTDNGTLALFDEEEITVTVNEVNDAPVAVNDNASTNEDTPIVINVPSNDTDVDGTVDLTSVVIVSGPTQGAVTVNPVTGQLTYTPNANTNGNDSFTYTIKDNNGLVSNAATVTITITPVNDAPIAVNDGATTLEDTPVVINVPGNDTDIDGTIDLTSVVITTAPSNGTVLVNTITGQVTYTPNPNYNGSDSFQYTVKDNTGAVSAAATVTITVAPVNDSPVAVNDNATVNEDQTLSASVAGNDSDVDHTAAQLTYSLVSGGTAASNGTLTLNPNGSYSYVPNANFNGTVSFTYQVCDPASACATATATISVTAVNDAPVANADNATTNEDNVVVINIPSNDTDVDGTIDLTSEVITSTPAKGTLSVNSTTGEVTYTPNANTNGSDSFTYTVKDNDGAVSNIATVSITVSPVNDAPVANNDNATTDEDAPVVINIPANDTDIDGTLDLTSVAVMTSPVNGTLSVNSITGAVTYTPNANVNGSDSFQYTIKDNNGAVSNVATVSITITSVNDAPVAVSDSETILENQALSASVAGNDSDVDHMAAQLSYSLVAGSTAAANGTLTFNPDGTYSYLPNTNYNGVVSFSYQVCDNATPAACATATVTITIISVNDPPVAVNDGATTLEDNPVTINVPGNDMDTDGSLDMTSVEVTTPPANGIVAVNPTTGQVTYTPNANFNGSDSFQYRLKDNEGAYSNLARSLLPLLR